MAGRLQDKVAIVCGAGASAGGVSIGMATAVAFAREGAKVFAVDGDLTVAQGTRDAITGTAGVCTLHEGDVTVSASIARMVDACLARYGRIDLLFNNVG